jgi:hypothetical protein
MFRHMGRRMKRTSKDKTSPAPRESHTENVSVLRPARRGSAACLYLFSELVLVAEEIFRCD